MSLQSLSPELIDHIIDQFDDRDIFTIKSCSLVSHAIARRSRERLFAYIRRKVVSEDDEPQLEECLKTSAAMRNRSGVCGEVVSNTASRGAECREQDVTAMMKRLRSNSASSVMISTHPILPCAADLVQNLELCGDYLRPAQRITTKTLRRILSYVPRLRRFQLHNFCLEYDEHAGTNDNHTADGVGFTAIALQELDLRLDFRTTTGLIRVLRLFSRTSSLRLRQIVSREAADFPQTQEEVEAEIARVAPSCPLDLLVTQLELYLWQIGPVCLELLKRAAYKSGVAVQDMRVRCDSGQRNFELLGAFFSDETISASVKNVTMVYPFYVPGPLPDFNALHLSALSALSSLTVEGFYLGEIHSPQPPFALIACLLSSWSALPRSEFQLTLDIVFARRLTESVGLGMQLASASAVDVTRFLEDSLDTQWEEIERVLALRHFPKVMFMLRSQAGPLEAEEKMRLINTVYRKLRGLHTRCDVTVEVSEP